MDIFKMATVVVVLAIFSIFYYYALKAEKIVNEKAKRLREAQPNLTGSQPSGKAKAVPKNSHTPKKVIQ